MDGWYVHVHDLRSVGVCGGVARVGSSTHTFPPNLLLICFVCASLPVASPWPAFKLCVVMGCSHWLLVLDPLCNASDAADCTGGRGWRPAPYQLPAVPAHRLQQRQAASGSGTTCQVRALCCSPCATQRCILHSIPPTKRTGAPVHHPGTRVQQQAPAGAATRWHLGVTPHPRHAALCCRDVDMCLTELAGSLPLDVMPGAGDPSNYSLPQQPLHKCLFPGTAAFPTLQVPA